MNLKDFTQLINQTRLRQACLSYVGLGILLVVIAVVLDKQEPEPYAAYYVGAINEAISPKFLELLTIIGLLALCVTLPVWYGARRYQHWQRMANDCRTVTHHVITLTFALVALALGILMPQILFGMADTGYVALWQAVLLGSPRIVVLLCVAGLAYGLGVLAQATEGHDNQVFDWLMQIPGFYLWPTQGLVATVLIAILLGQQ